MFKRRTLFVLGAGASAEVKLPVGTELATAIANLLNIPAGLSAGQDSPGERLLAQLYDKHPLSNNGYHRAAQAISGGVELTNSIDDYLDRHADDELVQRVGKAAIVKAIIDAEYESNLNYAQPFSRLTLNKIGNTWFVKFFRMLGFEVKASNAREIFNSVAFIVFNYDRCLEFFLLNSLQLVYGISYTDAASIVEDCHIIHPYGVVADLPGLPLGAGRPPPEVPFGGGDAFDCANLSAGIKIFTEQMAAAEMLSQIHEEIFRAEQIVFLGFGYHDPNMTILTPEKPLPPKNIFGTAKGMSDVSINRVRKQLGPMFGGISPQIADRSSADLFDYYGKAFSD
jgi:hypothetical protein